MVILVKSKVLYCINCSVFVRRIKNGKRKILVELLGHKAEQNEWTRSETEFPKC
jgi:ribosomal protein S26